MEDTDDEEKESGGIAGFFRGLFKKEESEPEEAASSSAPIGKLSARERLAALQKAKTAAAGKPQDGGPEPARPAGVPVAGRTASLSSIQAPASVPAPMQAVPLPAVPPPPPPPAQLAQAAVQQLAGRIAELEQTLAAVTEKLQAGPSAEALAAQAASAAAENEKLKARIAALEAHAASMFASQEVAAAAEARMGMLAEHLSAAETALSRLALKSGLQEKIGERDTALLRDRVDKLETVSATGADVEKQIATVGELACSFIKLEAEVRDFARAAESAGGFEAALNDLSRRVEGLEQQGVYVRKLEADRDDAGKRLLKLEAASEAVIAEQAKAAGTAQSEGAAIEDLRARFQNMAVIFDHIRRPLESAANKIIESALKHPADEDRR